MYFSMIAIGVCGVAPMGEAVFERMIMQKLQKTGSDMKSSRITFTALPGKRRGVAVMSVACSLARFTPRSVLERSLVHLRFVRSACNFHTGQLTHRHIQANTH